MGRDGEGWGRNEGGEEWGKTGRMRRDEKDGEGWEGMGRDGDGWGGMGRDGEGRDGEGRDGEGMAFCPFFERWEEMEVKDEKGWVGRKRRDGEGWGETGRDGEKWKERDGGWGGERWVVEGFLPLSSYQPLYERDWRGGEKLGGMGRDEEGWEGWGGMGGKGWEGERWGWG